MDCLTTRDLIHKRCDDELSPAEGRALAMHLEKCPLCAAVAAQMAALMTGLSALRAASEAPQRATELIRLSRRRRLVVRLAGWSAAAAVLLAALLVVDMDRPTRRSSPAPTAAIAPAGANTTASALELTGDSEKNYLAVKQPGGEPNVHVYWLLPTVRNQ